MWRFAILLVACTEHGQSPQFPPDDADPVPSNPASVGPFTPQICAGGTPGQPSCPFNQISLDEVGAPGSAFVFLFRPTGSGVELADVSITAGPGGLHAEHPEVRLGNDGLFESAGDSYAGVTLDLRPGAAESLATITVPGASGIELVLLRFDAIGVLE